MKLNIGNNIRILRRAADMTQDELADKLGVTFQTVSRWENGGSYPDIEFLPAIADVFDVTVDRLLDRGGDDEVRTQLNAVLERLWHAVKTREDDAAIGILRELRRDLRQYAEFPERLQALWGYFLNYRGKVSPEFLAEIRQFFEEYKHSVPNLEHQWMAIQLMTILEDEEHVGEFLKKHCVNKALTADDVLRVRYFNRGETEKLAYAEQVCWHGLLRKLFEHSDPQVIEKNLAYLHMLSGITPDPSHPVSGDGSLDLWVDMRFIMGCRLAEHCMDLGEKERAFVLLEDAVSLLENLFRQAKQNVLTLTGTPSILPTFSITAWHCWSEENGRRLCNIDLRYHGADNSRTSFLLFRRPGTDYVYLDELFTRYPDDLRWPELYSRLRTLMFSQPE